MPRTALSRTSSANLKASIMPVPLPASASSRWFGMVISVSTTSCSSSIPRSPCRARTLPSNMKGFVTTPTVRAPISRATSATIGAAPVPVPPPIPAVTKTMSEPSSCSRSRSRASRADARPRSGFAPQPKPRVTSAPSWIFTGARLNLRAWASVFAAMNSTPERAESIMVLSALPPPPPTPITLMLAFWCDEPSNSSRSRPSSGPSSSSSTGSLAWLFRCPPPCLLRFDILLSPPRVSAFAAARLSLALRATRCPGTAPGRKTLNNVTESLKKCFV